MKIVYKPENLKDWIVKKANLMPVPFFIFTSAILAKSEMLAFKFDVFDAAKDSPQTIEQIGQKTKLHPRGLRSLMNILTARGYFEYKYGKFGLTKISKKWFLKENPDNMCSFMRYANEVQWNELSYLEEFLRTGKGLQVHDTYTEEQWNLYPLQQEDLAKMVAKEAAKMIPMPSNPAEMLDIGGSHGLFSVELCKKYPTLKSTILELPQAVEKARPILAKFNMGDRISYRAGNALTDDFGENRYDLIFMAGVAHHFTSEQNSAVSGKARKALKPSACFVIQDLLRPETSSRMKNMVGVVWDMYFNLTSTAGLWSLSELIDFQQKGGLVHYKVNKFKIPYFVQVCAKKE